MNPARPPERTHPAPAAGGPGAGSPPSCHWTLVPMRGLAAGKSRLAPLLAPAARIALNTMLLQTALDAVVALDGSAAQCIVASAGQDALALARQRGAVALEEAPGTGLNAALTAAREQAVARGAQTLLVLAADLPGVTGAALARLRASTAAGCAAIIADRSGTGTNGLWLPAHAALAFSFGPHSLERHHGALRALGIETRIWRDAELAFDIDTVDDYLAWHAAGLGPGQHRGAA